MQDLRIAALCLNNELTCVAFQTFRARRFYRRPAGQRYKMSQPQLGATFVPGGTDDFYIPAKSPDVVSPAPKRLVIQLQTNGIKI